MRWGRIVKVLRAYRDHWLAAGAGILLALSFPYPGLFPLGWVGLVPLLAAVRQSSPRRAGRLGWEAGVVYHFGLLYWIVVAIHIYGRVPFAVALIPLVLLVAYLACFWGVFAWGVRMVALHTSIPLGLGVPVLWVALEYVRSFLLTGFPWESLGYSQYRWLSLIQISEWTGVYGISFLLAGASAVCWEGIRWLRHEVDRSTFFLEAGVLLAVTGFFLGYGTVRLGRIERSLARGEVLQVALIQGSINQDQKWETAYRESTLDIYFRLSREAAREGAGLIVWPETATPFYFERSPHYRARLQEFVRETGVPLLFGSPGVDFPKRPREGKIRHYNSAFLITAAGEVAGRYDKVHLVPFSEYYPLGDFLRSLERYIEGMGSFTPGDEVKNLGWESREMGVLICYEAIFPDLVRRFVARGADFLVNITNDAWFGRTSAPFQHHSMVVFRAIENRVPVARAANTGISSSIAVSGAIGRRTSIFRRGYLVERIRVLPPGRKTFYTRWGDLFARLLAVGALLMMVVSIWRKGGRQNVPRA